MSDVLTFQARGEYKKTDSLHQAAYRRLLRQVRPAVAASAVARLGLVASVLLVIGALLLALGLQTVAAPIEAAPAVSNTSIMTAPMGGSGCWVTGDLVGEANPAVFAAALCR